MAGSPPNLHTMDSRLACIQGVLKVKVKGRVIRALFWILGMSYSVIDGLVYRIQVRYTEGINPGVAMAFGIPTFYHHQSRSRTISIFTLVRGQDSR